jgi:hypothetical protein
MTVAGSGGREEGAEYSVTLMGAKLSATVVAKLTNYGKFKIAVATYDKGKAFIGASLLVRRQSFTEPNEYVALHLLCQETELILKGLLLLKDYDSFQPRLRNLGHRLPNLAAETSKTYSQKSLSAATRDELIKLSEFYSNHRLRYGSGIDLLIAPQSIGRERVQRRIFAVIKLTDRLLKKHPLSSK